MYTRWQRHWGRLVALSIHSAGDAITPRWIERTMPALAGPIDLPDKTTAEPERNEPDDEGKAADSKKPAAAAPVPAAPPEDKKPDEDKDKGGW